MQMTDNKHSFYVPDGRRLIRNHVHRPLFSMAVMTVMLAAGLAFCPLSVRPAMASPLPSEASLVLSEASQPQSEAPPLSSEASQPQSEASPAPSEPSQPAQVQASVGNAETGLPASSPHRSGVTLDITYGYDNTAKGSRQLPVNVKISNQQGQALDAILTIWVRESDESIYQYQYPIQTEEEDVIENLYYIPLGIRTDQLLVTLTAADGSILAEKRVYLNISLDVPELFIGLLSDHPQQLSYLNGAGINYSMLRTRSFVLSEEDFPEEEIGLEQLDVILVNDYRLRNLSEIQTAAIMDWVYNGGCLILGTGERVDDTLGRFAPELLDESYSSPEPAWVDLADALDLEQSPDARMEIPLVDISLHGGNVILSSQGTPLLTAVAKGQGMIAVAGFDFADIAGFCQKQPSCTDQLFTMLMGEERISSLAQESYLGNSSQFWAVQSLINTGDLDKLPNLALYTAIVVIYLALLGPGLYLFLKRRELQIYYRRGVVILSVCFAAVIYLMGTRTRFHSTFYTYASIQDVTSDYVTDTTYLNIRNPYNRPYKTELDPSYSVRPLTRGDWSGGKSSDLNRSEDYLVSIGNYDESKVIRGQNIVAFSPRYFCLERKYENTENIGITGEVDYFEGVLTGEITNQFPFPLENTCLILYGNMVMIDRLEPGETKQLDDRKLLRFPLNDFYAMAGYITGNGTGGPNSIEDAAGILAMERANMLTFYLETYLSGYSADARVVAFSTEKEEDAFLKTSSDEVYGLTMLTSSIAVNASRDRSLYRSVLMKKPRLISGNYSSDTNSMTGTEPVTLEYFLGTDIDVESLTFEPVSDEFSGNGSYSERFEGSIYFYNYQTGNFDLMNLTGETLDVEQLQNYLGEKNTITVRYVPEENGLYNSIQLPMPMVAGRER